MNSPSTETLATPIYTEEEFALIDPRYVPNHVVIIMDGNRRWAKAQGLPPEMGHWQGAEQLDIIVRAAAELGVKILTVYSFSTENWSRSKHEVEMLMQLLEAYLKNKKEVLVKEGVRLNTIGDTGCLPHPVQRAIAEAVQATKNGDRIELVLALNYGGRDEIRRAFVKMSQAEKEGKLQWNEVTEKTISSYLDTEFATQWSSHLFNQRMSCFFEIVSFVYIPEGPYHQDPQPTNVKECHPNPNQSHQNVLT